MSTQWTSRHESASERMSRLRGKGDKAVRGTKACAFVMKSVSMTRKKITSRSIVSGGVGELLGLQSQDTRITCILVCYDMVEGKELSLPNQEESCLYMSRRSNLI